VAFCEILVGDANHRTALEHECHTPLAHLYRYELLVRSLLKCGEVWALAAHAIMHWPCTLETTSAALLCDVRTVNQPHELAHTITVVGRRSKGVLRNKPTRREENKIGYDGPWMGARHGGEDRVQ
jgi:hypothetical protein